MNLPLPPFYKKITCEICGTDDNLVVTCELLSDPAVPIEWMCHTCLKAVNDARAQRQKNNK